MRKTLLTGALAVAATVLPAAAASAQDANHHGLAGAAHKANSQAAQKRHQRDLRSRRQRAHRSHTSAPSGAEQHNPQQTEPVHGGTTPPATPPSHESPTAPGAGMVTGRIASYTQSPYFGGVLVIQRANGERVTAYFGEKTDLECGAAGTGEHAFAPCTKDHLKPGTAAGGIHSVNSGGSDVWTKVLLLEGDGTHPQPPSQPPANPTPPPTGDHHGSGTPPAQSTAGGTIVSYEQSPAFGGTLTIKRTNGETVSAWYGDATDLRCTPGTGVEFAPCTKDQLKPGTTVRGAAHAVNAGGHDVWTHLYLVVPGFSG